MERLRIGDLVEVTTGKDAGKRGKLLKFLGRTGRVVVEGLNKVIKHTRPNQMNTEGGRLEKEAGIHESNVMPVDSESDKPTRVKFVTGEDGKKRRVAKSGADLKQG